MTQSDTGGYQAGLSVAEVQSLAADQPITKLSSNENPFGPSPAAVAAARDALEGANIYPERTDAALCQKLAEFHGQGMKPEQFFSANSGVEVLSLIEEALTEPGQRAIICPPCFGAYTGSLMKKGVVVDKVDLIGAGFDVHVDGILNAVTPDTRLVYLCNPNNPTGTYFGQDVLDAVLDGLPDHVTLIYDEVYFQFATEFDLPDALRHVRDDRNIVIVHSFSKAYGLAGMRVGYGIAPERIAAQIRRRKRSFHLNSMGMAAAIAALDDAAHLDRTVTNNTAERARLSDALKVMGFEVAKSQANFVMFRCPEGKDAKTLTNELVTHGVMVRPAFDLPNHIRATVGLPDENTRLLNALKSLQDKANP
ncbi:aminotransferase class I/II-fold pyridoxal phosphate-dependent enzyme [Tropicibacter sp. R16_0]|uniref:pyridoxal phosphate-dependent aminotransferase n=1 Tax=Tropicibacter sp. R16_0 TaxID=2821102 RepID=UPI001AD9F743|nr:histidinol-phosphate transaminase [Tropicibacter sp. R16_0]MBO9451105.1 aminotransferase class I/II-fold pyridoxal phosphate-dependent enzyme [Tropicibacter sp. R16_0]